MNTTPASLLERLRQPNPEAAWSQFVELYTPLLCYWARKKGLDEADVSDLVQDMFVILLQEMPTFIYRPDKRFRGWLWTIFVNQWFQRCRRRAARPAHVGGEVLDQLGLPDPLEEFTEEEYRKYLVDRALQLMQKDFQPLTWQACWEHVVAGRPAAEVAAELHISINQVHLAKSRVLRRLRKELEGLLD